MLATLAAYAGSATGPGVPVPVPIKDEFVPMVHMGLEGGADVLVGSNGGAFGVGPSGRLWADVQDTNVYRAQVGWGWTGHGLKDGSELFRDPVQLEATSGYLSTHTVTVGAKVLPLAGEKRSAVRPIDPWFYTGGGLSFAFAQVAWAGLPDPVATAKYFVVVDAAAGLDLRPTKILSFAPVLRVALHPALRRNEATGKLRTEAQLAIQPSLGATVHF